MKPEVEAFDEQRPKCWPLLVHGELSPPWHIGFTHLCLYIESSGFDPSRCAENVVIAGVKCFAENHLQRRARDRDTVRGEPEADPQICWAIWPDRGNFKCRCPCGGVFGMRLCASLRGVYCAKSKYHEAGPPSIRGRRHDSATKRSCHIDSSGLRQWTPAPVD